MRRRVLTEAEARAWIRVTATIRPIDETAQRQVPVLERNGETSAFEPSAGLTGAARILDAAPSAPARKPLAPADFSGQRRVVRGQVEVAATLDLHGHSQTSAARALPAFLVSRQREGARCVLVITGKGRDGEGVLRRNFLLWLETDQARAIVSGYARAHRRKGGDGAFYVFLKRAATGPAGSVSRSP